MNTYNNLTHLTLTIQGGVARIPIIFFLTLSLSFLALANDVVQEAQLVLKVDPVFPTQPHNTRNYEGWVELKYDVNESGDVINVVVLDALPHRIFNRSAKKALEKWKYSPKTISEKPVVSKGLITKINFKLVE